MGFIVMYDITNETSFLDIRNWLSQVRCPCITYCCGAAECGSVTETILFLGSTAQLWKCSNCYCS